MGDDDNFGLGEDDRTLHDLDDRITLLEARMAGFRAFIDSRIEAMREIRDAVRESVDLLRKES